MYIYPTVSDAIALHDILIDLYGGTKGIRDQGALEAAIFRSQSGYYNDLIAEAAAIWESMSQNHPFLDGNKRTAFAITHSFLIANGQFITASVEDAYDLIETLSNTNRFKFRELEAWLKRTQLK